jgi:hypothetical protein
MNSLLRAGGAEAGGPSHRSAHRSDGGGGGGGVAQLVVDHSPVDGRCA